MIGAITDLIQSSAIIIWAIFVIFLIRRVNRLQDRYDRRLNELSVQTPYKDPEPICGCTHHQCFHDDNGCGSPASDYYGRPTESPCGCKRYTGPEPLPQVIP